MKYLHRQRSTILFLVNPTYYFVTTSRERNVLTYVYLFQIIAFTISSLKRVITTLSVNYIFELYRSHYYSSQLFGATPHSGPIS